MAEHDPLAVAARRVSPYAAGLAPPSSAPPVVSAIVSPLRRNPQGLTSQIAQLAPLIDLVERLSGMVRAERLAPLEEQRIQAEIAARRASEEASRKQGQLLSVQAEIARLEAERARDPKNAEIERALKRAKLEATQLERDLNRLRIESERKKLTRKTRQDIEAEYYASHPQAVERLLDADLQRAEKNIEAYQQGLLNVLSAGAISPQAAYELGTFVLSALPVLARRNDPRVHQLSTHFYGTLQSAMRTAQEQGNDEMLRQLRMQLEQLQQYMPGGKPPGQPPPAQPPAQPPPGPQPPYPIPPHGP